MMHKTVISKNRYFLYVMMFALLSIVLRGYGFGIGDSVIQLPLLAKLDDAALFPTDDLFPVVLSNYTPLYSLILFVNSVLNNFSHTFFVLYVFSILVLFLGLYILAKTISGKPIIAAASLIFLLPSLHVGGAAILTVETSFVPRMLAIGVGLFAANTFFLNKYKLFFLLTGIVFLIHPTTALHILLLFVPVLVWRAPRASVKEISAGLAIFLVVICLFLPTFINNLLQLPMPFLANAELLEILKLRNPYAFPLQWSMRAWASLGILLSPLVLYFFYKKVKVRVVSSMDILVLLLTTSASLLLLLQILGTEVMPVSFIISLQLGRVWVFIVFLSFVYASTILVKIIKKFSLQRNTVWMAVILMVSFLIVTGGKFTVSQQHPDWIETQRWAKGHTSLECTYLVDFYSQGFRSFSERQIVGEYKDGTLSFYSQEFAYSWNNKRKFFKPAENGGYIQRLEAIRAEYPFSLIVLHNTISFNKDPIYRNNSYSVYLSDYLEESCRITT